MNHIFLTSEFSKHTVAKLKRLVSCPGGVMPKPAVRTYSRHVQEAVKLLGLLVRQARIERRLTVAQLAERAGVSRGLAHRVEAGDMGCAIGAAFELAAVVGVPLFAADRTTLAMHIGTAEKALTLLPKAARARASEIMDDF
jgi:DNA-binding XRE family transcriptional regulator